MKQDRFRHTTPLFTSVTLVLLMTASVLGQGLVSAPFPASVPTTTLHFQKPDFREDFHYRFLTGSVEAIVVYPLNPRLFAYGSLPLGVSSTYWETNVGKMTRMGTVLGNVAIGLGVQSELGKAIKLANSVTILVNTTPSVQNCSDCFNDGYRANYAGTKSDPYRGERFTQNRWQLIANSQWHWQKIPGLAVGVEVRPQWAIPDGRWGHDHFLLNGGLLVAAGSSRIQGVGEYVFYWYGAGDHPQRLRSRYRDAMGVGVRAVFDNVIPTFYYQFALDSYNKTIVNGTWGVRFDVLCSEEQSWLGAFK